MLKITANGKTRKAKWYEVLLVYLMAPFLVLGIIVLLISVAFGIVAIVVAILIGVAILLIFLVPIIIIASLLGRK